MNDKSWFIIYDFDGFVNSSRYLVFKFFGENEEMELDDFSKPFLELSKSEIDEMNEVLTFEESAAIIKNLARIQKNKNTNAIRYCINDKILMQIIEDLNTRLVSNILNSLVNKGILESAYDDEENDFVFWIKDSLENDNDNNQKNNKKN